MEDIHTTGKANHVLLRVGRLQLLLPQEDVGAAEYLSGAPTPTDQHGLFELPDQHAEAGDTAGARYLVALSPSMTLLAEPPPERFLLTALTARPELSLCWDEVKVLIDTAIRPLPLPPAVIGAGSPFTEYVELGDEVAFCCTGARLLAHVLPTQL
jgi:hypothetical protein